MDSKYTYDGKFNSNILAVAQPGCGKTTFIQNLAKNKLLRKLKEIFWLTKITLSKEREQKITNCLDLKVNFKYPQTVDEFIMEIYFFQRKKDNDVVNNVMGEENTFNKIIVMDDVLGLADKSNNFANFLTVARKFNFTCVYVFQTLYPPRSNW